MHLDVAADPVVVAEGVAELRLQPADGVEVLRGARVVYGRRGEGRQVAGGQIGEADRGFDADRLQRLDADDAGPRVIDHAVLGEAQVPGVDGAVSADAEDGRARLRGQLADDGGLRAFQVALVDPLYEADDHRL